MGGSPTPACQVTHYPDGRRYGYRVDLIFRPSLEVVMATEEAERCRERLKVAIELEDKNPFTAIQGIASSGKLEGQEGQLLNVAEPAVLVVFSLGPGTILRVRLRFEHDHILYGEYDPLLTLAGFASLSIGPGLVKDVILPGSRTIPGAAKIYLV